MTASNITIANLTTRGLANQINLQWVVDDPHVNGLPDLQFDHAEVRYAADQAMTSPVVLTTQAKFSFDHLQLLSGAEYWYQVRAVNRFGQFGAWCTAVNGQEAAIDSGAIASQWVDFEPVVTSGSGSLGAHTLNTCRYKQAGLFIFFTVDFTIDTVGTGTGSLNVDFGDLPSPRQEGACSGYRLSGGTYSTLDCRVNDPPGTIVLNLRRYDGTDPIVAGGRYVATGFYEIAS